MSILEMEVARSTVRVNKAIASHYESIDWAKRRYEIAKEVLPQCISTCNNILCQGGKLQKDTVAEQLADMAIQYADALIKKLKEEG